MRSKRKIVKILFTLLMCASSACAGTIDFSVSGTLTDGAVLVGTMTVDSVAGLVTAANFMFGVPDSETFSVVEAQGATSTSTWLVQTVLTGASKGSHPAFTLVLPTDTLVGYEGGSICSLSALCTEGGPRDISSGIILASGGDIFLQSGIATPEPATFLLLGIVLPVLILMRSSNFLT